MAATSSFSWHLSLWSICWVRVWIYDYMNNWSQLYNNGVDATVELFKRRYLIKLKWMKSLCSKRKAKSERLAARWGRTDIVLLGGTVQVVHPPPPPPGSVWVQLRYTRGSWWQKQSGDDLITRWRHARKATVTVSIMKVYLFVASFTDSAFHTPGKSIISDQRPPPPRCHGRLLRLLQDFSLCGRQSIRRWGSLGWGGCSRGGSEKKGKPLKQQQSKHKQILKHYVFSRVRQSRGSGH